MSGRDPDYKNADFALYRYAPSMVAAIAFCIIFLITTGLHTLQMFRTKTWYLVPFVIGGFFEFIGYAARAASAAQEPGYWTLMPYIVQNVFLLVAPALFAASIYMILGRIILLTDGESHSLIRSRWLTKLFVAGDIFSFLLQSTGGAMMATATTDPDRVKMGENMIIGGLFVQLIVFGLFMVVTAVFHWRMRLLPTTQANREEVRWQLYLAVLYVVSVLVMVRSVFRVVEYLQGHQGYLLTTEAFLFVFDAVLMAGVMVVMNWWHPSEIGLLLRGDRPGSSGFGLLRMSRQKGDGQGSFA